VAPLGGDQACIDAQVSPHNALARMAARKDASGGWNDRRTAARRPGIGRAEGKSMRFRDQR
jgi:hypothetical protein